jgi:DTW domain-containing protein YfiP
MPVKPRGFRQPRCAGCGLTPATCVCTAYPRLTSSIAISVVMTRSEARSASNSARLLSLWLPGVELHVHGREGCPREPEALVARPGSALLFPGGAQGQPLPPDVRHLIVPDGTWAQARRIERRWFAPSGLPRIALDASWPSVYRLRRGGEGGLYSGLSGVYSSLYSSLCTFEATALALGLLGQASLAEALLERFVEWARRAQRLKAGGSPRSAPAAPGATGGHPATDMLRALAQPAAPSPDRAAACAALVSEAPQRRTRM